MKKFLVPLLLAISVPVLAQDSTRVPFFKPEAIGFYSGITAFRDVPVTISDLQKIAPSSALLGADLDSFKTNTFTGSGNVNSVFGMGVDFRYRMRSNGQYAGFSRIRASIMYTNGQTAYREFYRNSTVRTDTVRLSNGQQFYVDSIHNEYYTYSWNYQALGIDLNQVFHTKDARIFSAYTGYGIHFGLIIGSYFSATHELQTGSQFLTTDSTATGSSMGYFTTNTRQDETENIATKNYYTFSFYVPVGFQVRFSKKKNFANKLCFFIEGRGGVNMMKVPGLGTRTSPFGIYMGGFRFCFENTQ
ncbi:MAG TPA: hypothetical protein VFU15_13225 [Bacteroidia bacterium]|nr:hypothetical protein [Bacteroidia bacterium]